MLNTVYRLVAPRRFEVAFSDIQLFKDNQVIVRPQFLSICHADQRYYQGLRPAAILSKKLPMALIHESIGVVVQSCSDNFDQPEPSSCVIEPCGHFRGNYSVLAWIEATVIGMSNQ